jgi:hypothetical protein
MSAQDHQKKKQTIHPKPDEVKQYIDHLKKENKKRNEALEKIFKEIDLAFDRVDIEPTDT